MDCSWVIVFSSVDFSIVIMYGHVLFQNRKSKGYAFIKFKTDEIAKVAAETMNNYIMFKKALQGK